MTHLTTSTRGGNRRAPLAEETWYLPLYLIDDKGTRPTGDVSLFVRSFRLRDRKSGPVLQIALDVWTFSDEPAMVEAIENLGLQELPSEADGDPLYVPESLVIDGMKVERTSVGVPRPGAEDSQQGPQKARS